MHLIRCVLPGSHHNINLIGADLHGLHALSLPVPLPVHHLKKLRVGNFLRTHLAELIRHHAHHEKRNQRNHDKCHDNLAVAVTLAAIVTATSIVVIIIRSLILHKMSVLSKQPPDLNARAASGSDRYTCEISLSIILNMKFKSNMKFMNFSGHF